MTHAELATAGYDVSPAVHARLAAFVERLLDENTKLNLTAIRQPPAAWVLHICDSLALLPLLDRLAPRSILDLGSGGGVPGIPLACARPGIRVTLLDSTRKKLDAAARIAAAIGLTNVRTLWGRAEVLSASAAERGQYDAVVVRAVAKLPDLIAPAAGFLRPAGQAWFMKSVAAVKSEVAAAAARARQARLTLVEPRLYELPAGHGQRAILVYEKQAH